MGGDGPLHDNYRSGRRLALLQRVSDDESAFNGVFREIEPPRRLVYTFQFEGLPGHVVVETVTLEAHDGQTKVTVHSRFDTSAARDGMIQSGIEDGATESWNVWPSC